MTRYTKKQGSMTYPKERHKPTETVPKKEQMVNLLDKDFRTTLLKMSKELKEDMTKVKKTMYE